MKTLLIRLTSDDKQTLGRFYAFDELYPMFECVALELPDRENEVRISRIPAGKYICKIRTSPKYGKHYIVEDVEGRSFILMHFGNYYTNTKGCILLGRDFSDIDLDGHLDITNSRKTMALLVKIMPDEFELTIIDE